jgi:hypothetical protein
MIARILFLIGLMFLAISVVSAFTLIIFSHLPERSLGAIALPFKSPPSCTTGRCGGGPTPTLADSPIDSLLVEKEWPRQLETNSSDFIRALLTTTLGSAPTEIPTAATGNHSLAEESPFPVGAMFNDPNTSIENAFGTGYEAFATANLVTTAFEVQLIGPQWRTLRQPSIEWDWNISPKTQRLGKQVIDMDIEVQWIPKVNKQQQQGQILSQIWQSHVEVEVISHWVDMGQISIGSLVTGFLGSGLTIPWLWEQVEKRRKEKKEGKKVDAIHPFDVKPRLNDAPEEREKKQE